MFICHRIAIAARMSHLGTLGDGLFPIDSFAPSDILCLLDRGGKRNQTVTQQDPQEVEGTCAEEKAHVKAYGYKLTGMVVDFIGLIIDLMKDD